MAHKRMRTVTCGRCNGTCTIKANLDTGTVEEATLPRECKWPSQRCATDLADGVFDRQFGSRLIRPQGMAKFSS